MPTRGKKDPNGRALRGRRAHTTFISDPIAQIWSNYNVRSGAAGAATPEQPAVQNCLYDRFEALYKKSSIKPSLVIVPARFKSGTLYSEIPTSGAGDFTVTRATTATRVNASGLIESVASGIPRLDYYTSGGTVGCPALLVEPSAQNLAFNSQTWDATNNWLLSDGSGRVTVATATSGTLAPDGLSTANAISPTSGNITHYLYSNASGSISYVSGTVYTVSAFFKKGAGDSGRYIQICTVGSRFVGNPYANFDLELGTVATVSGSAADGNRVSRIQNYGNGWYRCSLTATCNNSGTAAVGVIAVLLTADTNARIGAAFAGNTSDYIFGWGAQVETGSVATSYIPTTTGSVTRNADIIRVSGAVSGSIGSTEGTIYAEVDIRNATAGKCVLQIDDGTATNRIGVFVDASPTRITLAITSGGNFTAISGSVTTGTHKIAVSYVSGSQQVYLDGAFLVSGTANLPTVSLTNSSIGTRILSGVYGAHFNDRIRAAALYTTRLTNEQLAFITQP